jgi:hypothetical protein
MAFQQPHRPHPTNRTRRPPRRARQAAALGVPLLDGAPGQAVTIPREVRSDLPPGFDTFTQPPDPTPGTTRRDRSRRRIRWPFGAAHSGGIGWPPLHLPYLEGDGGPPWWVTRLLPLLAVAGVVAIFRQWLLVVALLGIAVVAGLHHYVVSLEVESRLVRIIYPLALVIACLTFASSPLWTRHLQPLAATALQAAGQVATAAIDRARHPNPDPAGSPDAGETRAERDAERDTAERPGGDAGEGARQP